MLYSASSLVKKAVRGGFEPPVRLHVRQFSKLVVSATHPPHRFIKEHPRIVGGAKLAKGSVLQNILKKKISLVKYLVYRSHQFKNEK